jgi:hypothetical protein
MAFTTREFPNKVFEDLDDYRNYLKLREAIINRLKLKDKKTRVVKVASAIKQKDPIVQLLLKWISQYRKT